MRAELLPVLLERIDQRRDVAARLQWETASYLLGLKALTEKMKAGSATEKKIRDFLNATGSGAPDHSDLIPRESHLSAHND